MQESKSYSKSKLYFSRWSRKSYAVFISLGRDVKISRLSIDMCGKALLKLNKLSMFLYEKLDYLFNTIDVFYFKKIDISYTLSDAFHKFEVKELSELSLNAYNYSINKDLKDNSGMPGCLFCFINIII